MPASVPPQPESTLRPYALSARPAAGLNAGLSGLLAVLLLLIIRNPDSRSPEFWLYRILVALSVANWVQDLTRSLCVSHYLLKYS